MSNKPKVYNPIIHRRGTTEEGLEVEYQEIPDPGAKSPVGPTSSNDAEKSNFETFRLKERSSTLAQNKEKEKEAEEDTDEDKEVDVLYQELRGQKKANLLKNYTKDNLRDPDVREDYFVLLCFLSLYGGDEVSLQDLRTKSVKLSSMNYLGEKPNQVLRRKEFISMVLIAAAGQSEDALIKEIIKNDSLGYIVSIQVVLAFLKADHHQLLKSLLKVVEATNAQMYPVGAMASMIPENLSSKAALTANNMPKRGKTMKGVDYLDENSDRRKRGKTRIESGMTIREMAGTLVQMATLRRPTIIDRDLLPRSAYDNVIIEARFDTVFPHLVQMKRMDLVEPLIDYFGEKHINHLNLFIGFGQEELAIKHYNKFMWELTETQIIMLLERKMWKFLCTISDEAEKLLFFKDLTFTAMAELLHDGKVLSEIVLLFTTLPIKGWRQNQVLVLAELGKSLLSEDPENSRLIFANNPILICAQLSHLIKHVAVRFRFLQNELEDLSQDLEKVAYNLQNELRESNLYALYLTPLPTGLTMLDYVLRMEMKSLVETKFTKGLVLEFWNDESSVTGSRNQMSYLAHAVKVAKRFRWDIDLRPGLDQNFIFQFGNTMNSPKYMLLMDLCFLAIFYGIFDTYLYQKLMFFDNAMDDPTYIESLPAYFLDTNCAEHHTNTIVYLFFLLNYWISFLYRCIHLSTNQIGKLAYKVGYIGTFLCLTLVLLFLVIFPSYESQVNHQMFIRIVFVVTRAMTTYTLLASMLGFQHSGELVTIISTVVVSLAPILCLLVVYMLFYSEIMHNFFYEFQLFNTSNESFFSLVEVLFGSLAFGNMGNDGIGDSLSMYFTMNINLTYFSFSSNLLATFLIIAYLSSILETVRKNASYQNTTAQYYYLQMFSETDFKGFYAFPSLISIVTVPFLLLYRLPHLASKVNMFLLRVRFYIVWVPFQLFKFWVLALFYYGPYLYIRNMILIAFGKMGFEGSRLLHLALWILVGPINMTLYFFVDAKMLLQVLNRNFELSTPQIKLLARATDDNVIYMHRYGMLRDGINASIRKAPDQDGIAYMDLLDWLMTGGKHDRDHGRSEAKGTRNPRELFVEIVKEMIRKKSGSKWLKSVNAAKKKLFREILDGFLSYKAINLKQEEATLDSRLVLDLLAMMNDQNISYLRAKHISSIQMVLLNAQSREQISIMNKIEELDKKVDVLNRLWSSHLPKFAKSNSLFQVASPI